MSDHVWTIAEAKARMSEIMRKASSEGPQRIGTQKRYVLVLEAEWEKLSGKTDKIPLGRWLVENLPRGIELELPDRNEPVRPPPFADEDG